MYTCGQLDYEPRSSGRAEMIQLLRPPPHVLCRLELHNLTRLALLYKPSLAPGSYQNIVIAIFPAPLFE